LPGGTVLRTGLLPSLASGEAACTLDACRARLMPDADLVLEGGGMKGIGLGGAASALMRAGYTFPRVAGTSAGAIVAAFLAAGIGERGLVEAMARLRYDRVPDRGLPKIPILSEGLSLLHSAGAYRGDYIRGFVRDELERLGVRTFGDLRRSDGGDDASLPPERRHGLVVVATDITQGGCCGCRGTTGCSAWIPTSSSSPTRCGPRSRSRCTSSR